MGAGGDWSRLTPEPLRQAVLPRAQRGPSAPPLFPHPVWFLLVQYPAVSETKLRSRRCLPLGV